jgi:hypothetical protein
VPRCAGKKSDGSACERIVGASGGLCYAHDTAFAEDHKRAASKAARSPAKGRSTSEIREITRRLRDLLDGVLEGRVDRAVGAVANQICNSLLRAVEIERRAKVEDDLELRLDEIEDLLGQTEERVRYGGR